MRTHIAVPNALLHCPRRLSREMSMQGPPPVGSATGALCGHQSQGGCQALGTANDCSTPVAPGDRGEDEMDCSAQAQPWLTDSTGDQQGDLTTGALVPTPSPGESRGGPVVIAHTGSAPTTCDTVVEAEPAQPLSPEFNPADTPMPATIRSRTPTPPPSDDGDVWVPSDQLTVETLLGPASPRTTPSPPKRPCHTKVSPVAPSPGHSNPLLPEPDPVPAPALSTAPPPGPFPVPAKASISVLSSADGTGAHARLIGGMSVVDVQAWAALVVPDQPSVGQRLADEEVDGEGLELLTDLDMQELGLRTLGPRRKFQSALERLKAEGFVPAPAPEPCLSQSNPIPQHTASTLRVSSEYPAAPLVVPPPPPPPSRPRGSVGVHHPIAPPNGEEFTYTVYPQRVRRPPTRFGYHSPTASIMSLARSPQRRNVPGGAQRPRKACAATARPANSAHRPRATLRQDCAPVKKRARPPDQSPGISAKKRCPPPSSASLPTPPQVTAAEDLFTRCGRNFMLLETVLALPVASRAQLRSWGSELAALRGRNHPVQYRVMVRGETGAGKSTLLNALLGEAQLLPTNAMRACTAAVVELSALRPEDPKDQYVSEIEFITAEEWQREIDLCFGDLDTGDGHLHRPPRDSPVAQSWHRLQAVYGRVGATRDDTLAMGWRAENPNEVGTGIRTYASQDGRDPEAWPPLRSSNGEGRGAGEGEGAATADGGQEVGTQQRQHQQEPVAQQEVCRVVRIRLCKTPLY